MMFGTLRDMIGSYTKVDIYSLVLIRMHTNDGVVNLQEPVSVQHSWSQQEVQQSQSDV